MFTNARTAVAALAVCTAAAFGTAQSAEASTVIDSTVPAFGVDYIFFDFAGGNLQINVDGVTLSDPMISLFVDDGSAPGALTGALLGTDDDGGSGLNSELTLNLADDSYVLAVGSWFLAEGEARSGVASTPGTAGSYRATFNQTISVAAVPLPASLPLLLAGLGAVGVARRRKNAA